MLSLMAAVSSVCRSSVRRRLTSVVAVALLLVSCGSTEPEPYAEFRLTSVNGVPLPIVVSTSPEGDLLLTAARVCRGGALAGNELGIAYVLRRNGADFQQTATLIGRRAGLVTEYDPGPCNDTFLAAACIALPTLRSTTEPADGRWRLEGRGFPFGESALEFIRGVPTDQGGL